MQPQYIEAEDADITIIDASSDMLVIDISNSKNKYKIGDLVSFKIKYMGALLSFKFRLYRKKNRLRIKLQPQLKKGIWTDHIPLFYFTKKKESSFDFF